MSKIKFTVSILIILFLSAVQVLAQGWSAVLNINPYPSPYISDWQNNPASLGSMTIYRTGTTSEEVTISVNVTLNNVGVVLNGVTEPFIIPPTPSYIVDNTKILKIDNPSYPNSDLKSKTVRSGRLPEGEYTVCVTVRNNDNVILVSNVCSNFTILYPQPPQLIAPLNGDSLEVTNKYPTFTWTPVIVPPDYQIKYSLKVAEILPGQTAQQALSANVLQYENDNITTPSLIYPIDALPLDTGKTYAWQIQALDQNGFPPTQNNGKSEIFIFNYKHAPTSSNSQLLSGKLPASFNCGCSAPAPQSTTVKTNFTLAADKNLTIGKFKLKISKITKQPDKEGKFSGEGTIPFPLINSGAIPLKVVFNDIQINDSYEVISGGATGVVSDNVDFLPAVQQPAINTVPLTITDVQNLKQYFNKYPKQLASQAEAIKNSFGFDLPLGIDKQIAGKKVIVAITGMTFTPTNAVFDAAVEMDLPDATPNAIAFGAKNICIDKYDICGQGTLFLAKDIDLNIGSGKLKLKGFKNSGSPADSGTYIVFDNKGFKNLHIQAEYDFPTSLLVQTDNVSPVAATVTANANSWTNWIGSIKIDKFKINGLKDFTFIPGTAYYDHSDLQNPQNIPVKYISSSGSLWHGFFLPQLKIELPAIIKNNTKNQPLQISVNNLVIDNQGVSVDAVAKNILSIGDGSLSGWYYSIDSLSIEFIKNSLSQSTMGGKVVLPISGNNPNSSGSQLNYTCNLTSPANKGMNLQFLIKPKDNVNFQIAVAKMNIDKSSTIEINLGGNGNYAKTNLSGTLSIGINKPKISFKAVKFQGLQIQTQKPYLTVKSLTAGFASPQKDVGGFPVSFKDIKPKIKGTKLGLSFDVDINLCKEIPKVPKGNFGLTIWGYIDYNPVTKRFSGGYSNTEIDSIGLDGQLGPVHIKGIVNFYDDKNLENAIGGKVSVKMLDGLGLTAEVLFGKKDSYYWYVDGNFMLSVEDAIPLPGTPLRIFGFGGGAYYNLQQSNVPKPNEIFSKERAAATYSYSKGTMGFLATIIIGSADGEALQANGTMQFEFNTSNGFAVSKVIFKVDAALLTPLMQQQKSMITGNGYIYLDFANEIYTAGFGMKIRVPKKKPQIITADGGMDLLINAKSNQWYFHIGTPEKHKRISVSILNAITLKAYFMMGDNIPGIPKPDIPSDILSGYNTTSRDPSIGLGTGIAFGASFQIDKHFKFLIFYGHLYAGLGFDMAIRKLSQGCSGSSNLPGINGWYAQGQLYAYGGFDAGLHVDVWFFKGNVSILKLNVAAIFSVSGPNPTWFKGWLHGGYSALDGLVHGEMSFNVVYSPNGKCEVPLSNPLGGIPLISEVKPEGSGVSILSNAEASFTFPVKKLFTIDQIDNNGHKIVRSFRLLITRFDIYKGSSRIYGINTNGNYIITGNDRLAIYSKKIAFSPQSEYKIVVAVKAQEKKNGIWKDSYDGGKLVEDKRTQEFTTGDCIVNLFKNGAVIASYPFDRQRYLLQKEYNRGYILLSQAIPCLTKDPNYNLKAVFYSYGNKPEVQESNVTISGNYLYFNLPPLPNSTITMVAIVKRPKVTNKNTTGTAQLMKPQNAYMNRTMSYQGKKSSANIRTYKISNLSTTAEDVPIYEYYFKTSRYNTLKEKLDASDYSTNAKKEVGYVGTYKLAEGFDYYDINGKVIAGNGAYPDRYIRPLVYVSEDITKNRWYKDYVEPLYDKAASTHKVLPARSFNELALYGYYPPTGRIILYSPGIEPKLTDAEIATTLPTMNHNHSGLKINTHKTNTF